MSQKSPAGPGHQQGLESPQSVSTRKARIEQKAVSSFLEKHLGKPVTNLTFIEGGEGSQAFSFGLDGRELIIRVNTRDESFKKDDYAFKHFRSERVPIPEITEIGRMDEKHHYAISERVDGKKIDAFSEERREAITPELFKVLDAIHDTDISKTSGYGKYGTDGNGRYPTWKDSLKSHKKWVEAPSGGPSMFETTILEKDLWEKVYAEILALIKYCPEERHLIHRDYGFDNVFSGGEKITGVIDWGEGGYGDFLYDGAWMSYWSKDHKWREEVRKHYEQKGVSVPHFEERMRCYELHIGLGALSFYADSKQNEKYEKNKARLLALLK